MYYLNITQNVINYTQNVNIRYTTKRFIIYLIKRKEQDC